MSKKQFIVLLVLVVVIGIWGVTRWRGQSSSWSGGGDATGKKLLGEFDVNAVTQLAIKRGTNELLLAKKDDLWRVAQREDYPANFSEISAFLLKAKNLKVVQTEQIGASQLGRLELAPSGTNAPTVVEFRDASGKALKTLTLGKKHMRGGGQGSPMDEMGGDGGFPDGRYVQVGDKSDSVAVISDALTDIEPDAGRWLSKDFFKVEKIKSIAVTFPEATNSWKLIRETESGEWKLADAKPEEKLDSAKTSSFSYALSSPSFTDVAIGVSPAQTGLDKPTTVVLETFDGFTYTVHAGAKTNENIYFTVTASADLQKERTPGKDEKPEDKERLDKEFKEQQKKVEEKLAAEKKLAKSIYLVSNWTVDSLLKERSTLLAEKKEDAKKADADPTAGAAGLPDAKLPGQ